MSEMEDLVEAAEPNPLLGRVDALAERRDWEGLVELATRCLQATERGKQLWPIAEHIDYRLALEAPGPYAGAVLHAEAGRFALGPLTEVAASTHEFADLAEHIRSPHAAGFVAAERVVRKEDLRTAAGTYPETLEMPMFLAAWEPDYPLAVYRAAEAVFPDAEVEVDLLPSSPELFDAFEDEEVHRTLGSLVDVWVSRSNGAVEITTGDGSAPGAITNLGFEEFQMGEISLSQAVATMAWAAASGGARGRRRGAAFGRFAAWTAASTLADIEWPPDPDELGEAASELRWFLWQPSFVKKGWSLHLAIESKEGWAAAIAATDLIESE